tara:strand:- start:15837 stop:17099 length:1263 start_codon:yes stop_codon:yes gene_type:complete
MIQINANKIIENISFLSVGQVIKVLVRLLAFSIITRSLTIDQYGQVLTVIAFCELFQIFTLPGINKNLERAACRDLNNIDQILSSKSGIRNYAAIIAISLVNIIVTFLSYDEIVINLIRFYSLVLLVDSLKEYTRIIFKAFEDFKWISFSEVFQSISYLALVLISISYQFGIEGIVAASILSTIFGFLFDFINSKKYSRFKLFGGASIDKVFLISASVFTLTNIMWLIITKIDIFMLSILGSSEEVAIYGVANRIIFFGLIATSLISNVIYPPLVKRIKEYGNLQITKKHLRLLFYSCLAIVCGCAIAAILSDSIITLIAGDKYLKSAEIFNILLLFLIFQALAVPIKLIMYAADKEKLFLLIVMPLPFIKIILNYFGFKFLGINGLAFSTVIVYLSYLIVMVLLNKDLLKSTLSMELNR